MNGINMAGGENRIIKQLISEGAYFKPSKNTRILAILDALSLNSGLSQFELGRRLNLSGAMVNQYLKQMQSDGLVEFQPVNGKSYRYQLTETGETARRRMLADYSSETVRIYTTVKEFIQERLNPLEDSGKMRLVLFGASETCEVVLSTLLESRFQVVALVDNDSKKHGKLFHGYVVSSPVLLEQVECDAVVITSFGKQDEIYAQVEPVAGRMGIDIVRF
ncbi:winged helix-turn-helix transcriptional regulator [Salidesulfovibrio brasiliensis]|uniref:winged helix-turn-helix transcriptional regulator n=1 Tax=Salidesulfovibrio brasiliensis TaxID=221711 RepID=UPI0009F8E09B|nr:winged helix-turn-helix transcriptional regulator [Salidesulfovibrio brasiliensis]